MRRPHLAVGVSPWNPIAPFPEPRRRRQQSSLVFDAKNRFGRLLDAVQSAPVRVTKKGRAVGVMMSIQQYERLRGAAWERLTMTIDALGKEASANGLTDAGLEVLLADES